MCEIVDGTEKWVVANYRETQLPNISVGAKVKMEVDAVPGVEYEGIVERISDATGSAYSMIPQDNATGNFVKIEQRVPVRIRFTTTDKEALARLRAGMNVECEVLY
jgi:membrane fusion protein (multidrug efflux system)